MEGYCSKGQSPQWAVVPVEEKEEEEEENNNNNNNNNNIRVYSFCVLLCSDFM
jgi:hypothetical protein